VNSERKCKEPYLLQAPVLSKSPVGHDKSSNSEEDITGNGLCCNIESQPLVDLCGIVCTSNNIEEKAAWDLISTFSSRSTEIPQNNMAIEIRNLTEYSKPKPDLNLKVTTYGCIKWMVHIISNIRAKGPVIRTVAENIGKGRGCVAEAMHEKCFQNSFGVMETPIVQGICLHRVDDTFAFVTKVLIDNREVIEDWIEKQRPQILEEE
jgi:hypothetical protein